MSIVLVFVTKDQDIVKIHVAFVCITSQLNSCASISWTCTFQILPQMCLMYFNFWHNTLKPFFVTLYLHGSRQFAPHSWKCFQVKNWIPEIQGGEPKLWDLLWSSIILTKMVQHLNVQIAGLYHEFLSIFNIHLQLWHHNNNILIIIYL